MTEPLKVNSPRIGLSQNPVRGLREASIPVGTADTVAGKHTTTFTGKYHFNFFLPPFVDGLTPQLGSLIHGGLDSQGVFKRTISGVEYGEPSYYNVDTDTFETSQTYQGDATQSGTGSKERQSVQVPWHGASKLNVSLAVHSIVDYATDRFKLTLYRSINEVDSASYVGNQEIALAVAQWMAPSTQASSNVAMPFLNFLIEDYQMPVGSSFFLQLENLSNPGATNALMGSIFFR